MIALTASAGLAPLTLAGAVAAGLTVVLASMPLASRRPSTVAGTAPPGRLRPPSFSARSRRADPVRTEIGRSLDRGPARRSGRLALGLGPQRIAPIAPAAVLVLAVVLLGPIPGLALLGVAAAGLRSAARRRVRRRRRRLDDSAPDLVDLFGVAIAAGQPVPTALVTIAPRAPGPTQDAMRSALHRLEVGGTVSAALEQLRALGDAYEPLIEVLIAGHARGGPLLAALDRIAETTRDRRRRDAESRARRLPVTMLFPLVVCTLPAFGLLAVVPLLVASLTDLL